METFMKLRLQQYIFNSKLYASNILFLFKYQHIPKRKWKKKKNRSRINKYKLMHWKNCIEMVKIKRKEQVTEKQENMIFYTIFSTV